ncbi:MAG TPA: hypothetical protein VH857_01480 [Actinomycetes bacterium]|nr:hypothetical protein [Actinomycetes bacterium]
MSETHGQVDPDPSGRSECWCCGTHHPPGQMVTLGNHSEVTICPRCTVFLRTRAREIGDRDHGGVSVLARDGLRMGRDWVVERGLHRSAVLGPPLRWLGRHLP